MNKIILPKNLASAIEHLMEEGYTKAGVIAAMVQNFDGTDLPYCRESIEKLHEFYMADPHDGFLVVQALVLGYEVELTMREKLQFAYDHCTTVHAKAAFMVPLNILSDYYPELKGAVSK
jgi:hypothetical protein